jgi:voltage-gated potassium channel Kch
VGFLLLASYPPAWAACRSVLATILSVVALLLLADILVSSTSVAFVSRFPAHPLRTALFTAFAFVQIAIAFAVFYVLAADFNRKLNPISATYFSVVTMTTLGYGDIYPKEGAWLGQLIVVCQLVVGLYFLSTLLAVVANWSNAPPTAPAILEVKDVAG